METTENGRGTWVCRTMQQSKRTASTSPRPELAPELAPEKRWSSASRSGSAAEATTCGSTSPMAASDWHSDTSVAP